MGLFRRQPPVEETEARSTYSLGQLGGLASWFMSMPGQADALSQAAVWACRRVLAGSASTLPLDAFRAGSTTPISPAPQLIVDPSQTVSLDVWVYQLIDSFTGDGNVWGMILSHDGNGRPTQIETLDPKTVHERKVLGGHVTARIDGKVHHAFPHGDLWHVPGLAVAPGSPFGLSPMEAATRTANTALAAEDFGSRFFTDGGHPSAILKADKEITAEQAQGIKDSFLKAANGREPAVMGSGLEYQQMQINPSDSQFIDLLRFEVENICRYFGVPPSMVFASVSGQSVTYANVSQADLHYLKHSLDPYLVRVEKALSSLLAAPRYVKFNRNALLRTDTQGRYDAYEKAIRNGWMSPNDVLELEDRPPVPGGDRYNWPPYNTVPEQPGVVNGNP